MNLWPGRKYAVIHRSHRQTYRRRSVMLLLGHEHLPAATILIFDTRPLGGTIRMPLEWIIDLRPVGPSVPISLNEVLKP